MESMKPLQLIKLEDGSDRIIDDGTLLFKVEGRYLSAAEVAEQYGVDAATWTPLQSTVDGQRSTVNRERSEP